MAKSETEVQTIQYRIYSINIPNYLHTESSIAEPDPEDVTMQFGWSLRINEIDRLVAIEGRVIAALNTDPLKPIFQMMARCTFEVSTFDPVVRKNDILQLPNVFVIELLGITYSTMRGMLFERLAGTMYRGLILPPADPATLFMHGTKPIQQASEKPQTSGQKKSAKTRSKGRS